jgi:hypothetical protein
VQLFLFALSYACRTAVAVTFVISALWKIAHPAEFSDAARGILPAQLSLLRRRRGAWVISSAEILIGILLLTFNSANVYHYLAILAALFFLSLFTLALARAPDLSGGCGCWSSAGDHQPRGVYLSRNLVLAILLLAGSKTGTMSPALMFLAICWGSVVSLTLMHLPEIRMVWLAGTRPTKAGVT